MKVLILALTLVLSACQKNIETPEASLKDFVDARMGKVVDREFILARVTGKMLENFKTMSETELARFWDMKNIQSESFKILEKSCQPHKCILTYSVGYSTKNENKVQFVSVVQKIAEMVLVDDRWLISDVNNVSTYHESLEPINPLQP